MTLTLPDFVSFALAVQWGFQRGLLSLKPVRRRDDPAWRAAQRRAAREGMRKLRARTVK